MNINVFDLTVNGTHTSIQKTFYDTVRISNNRGYYNIQIFMGSPYSLIRKQFTDEDLLQTKRYIDDNYITVFTHLPYVINLAGSAKLNKYCWNGDEDVDEYVEKCIRTIEYECKTIGKIQPVVKGGCVLHVGSIGTLKDRKKGLECVAESINKINFTDDCCKLILETMVGRGGVLGTSFTELQYIYSLIKEEKRKYIGFCIDTCHIFAEGLYKLDVEKDVDRMFDEFFKYFRLSDLSLFHLNDSVCQYNSKQDRHATLKNGCIWSVKAEGLKHLVKKCKEYDIPIILETEESDYPVVQELSNELPQKHSCHT